MKIDELNKLSFIEANKKINSFLDANPTVSDKLLKDILTLKESELTSTFVMTFEGYTESQLAIMTIYINNNLGHDERFFVSDLIDFASAWGLNINYKKLLIFLSLDEESEHFVVLSSLQYITENIKLLYIEEIVNLMKKILDNPNFFQNVQIRAALCLFRITHDSFFLDEIKDWFDCSQNLTFLENTLKLNYYSNNLFVDIKKILNI